MSDYISRETMSETPKCPYCGDRMKIRVSLTTPDWGLLSAQYKCMTCESTSPRIEFHGGTPNDKIIERLQAMSSRRVEPTNRVLIPKEIVRIDGAVWLEEKSGKLTSPPIPMLVYGEDDCDNNISCIVFVNVNADKVNYLVSDYNHNWRCWTRKPTPKEMEATPWES